jgi:polar amino acid transport system permease protein
MIKNRPIHILPDPLRKIADRFALLDVIQYAAVVFLFGWLLWRGEERLGYNWQWYRVTNYLPDFENGRLVLGPLAEGLGVTLKITAASMILAFLIGLITALLRLSRSTMAKILARSYLELIRNTPLLVQLFFIYFVLSPILAMDAFTAAVLSLSLFEGAYISEIFRAGIVSVEKGHWEAAFSIGLNVPKTYLRVVLPQAIRRILPPLTSQAVSLVKDSALVSTIAIYDLTMQGQIIIARTYLVFEIWFTVAAIYLVITTFLSLTVRYLENRLRIASY